MQARHSRRDLLLVEEPVLWDRGFAVEVAKGTAERECPPEEASCGKGTEQGRVEGVQLIKRSSP